MSLPLILAGAGILGGLLKSQQYYPAAQAPSRAQIYGDALGGGIGGYLGGSQLGGSDPLGILGGLGGLGGRPQDIGASDVNLPQSQAGSPRPIPIENFGRAEPSQNDLLLQLLTNGGFSGGGLGQYTQPRNQGFGALGGILGGLG